MRWLKLLIFFSSVKVLAAEASNLYSPNRPKVATKPVVIQAAPTQSTVNPHSKPIALGAVKPPEPKSKKPLNSYAYYKIFDTRNSEIGFSFVKIVEDRAAGQIVGKRYIKVDITANGVKRRFDTLGYFKTDLEGYLISSETNNYYDKKWVAKNIISKSGPHLFRYSQFSAAKTMIMKFPPADKLVLERFIYYGDAISKIKSVKIYDDISGFIQTSPYISNSKKSELTELKLDFGKNRTQRMLYSSDYELLEANYCEKENQCYYQKKYPATEKILDSNPQKKYFDKNI